MSSLTYSVSHYPKSAKTAPQSWRSCDSHLPPLGTHSPSIYIALKHTVSGKTAGWLCSDQFHGKWHHGLLWPGNSRNAAQTAFSVRLWGLSHCPGIHVKSTFSPWTTLCFPTLQFISSVQRHNLPRHLQGVWRLPNSTHSYTTKAHQLQEKTCTCLKHQQSMQSHSEQLACVGSTGPQATDMHSPRHLAPTPRTYDEADGVCDHLPFTGLETLHESFSCYHISSL